MYVTYKCLFANVCIYDWEHQRKLTVTVYKDRAPGRMVTKNVVGGQAMSALMCRCWVPMVC